ncbi:neutrophil cytosol factor 2 [Takifugu rubripes]|uniref:p67phox protein n=1 Tax=Takifugu rubripes TaxID=31033 RepID=Q7T043_TAKRU|nr:neutrophil cytosol factor 2 [Takifugu rubripes]BAC79221.1 p67phox [Takifugu rubripes]|eukprot:NP_001027854.1 neutrophil cytosol factor 2 [Takifugu rubripes]
MSFLDTLKQWDKASTVADRQEFSEALEIFLSIEEPNSKIYFNIGCLHLLNEDLKDAEKAFDSSICKDEHLAVAFFQRAITFYKMTRYEESLADFQQTLKELRGNQLIDYGALGLRYKLNACEVLHNIALTEAQMGHWEKAQESLVKALDYRTESKLGIIDNALQATLKQKLFKLIGFPSKVLFKPNKHYVAELEKKDYLGKAKVVASVVPQDEFSGFAPLMPQVESGQTFSKPEPELLRALEGEPHTVLYKFVPETSDELAVVPGNVVFVLQKGADNWASVVFNERRGLVPYNYLERLEITMASKQNNVQSRPPSRQPPTRPERKSGLPPCADDRRNTQMKESELADDSCVVKVRYTFTFAILVPRGSSYATLAEKISEKLSVPANAIVLSLSSEATEQNVIDGGTDMEGVWSRVSGRCITLWCRLAQTNERVQKESSLLALHSYDSSNPEDLSFHQGDRITLLSKVNQDWLEGEFNGNTGIFPAAFVEEVPANG